MSREGVAGMIREGSGIRVFFDNGEGGEEILEGEFIAVGADLSDGALDLAHGVEGEDNPQSVSFLLDQDDRLTAND